MTDERRTTQELNETALAETGIRHCAITLSLIVEAQSLNYDEGFANVAVLKKLRRGSGQVDTYCSRQALRYSIVRQGKEQFGWELAPVTLARGERGGRQVPQFERDAAIERYQEIDLFGYMSTEQNRPTYTRTGAVRLDPLISCESFTNDIEFLTSKWMTDRYVESNPNLAANPPIAISNVEHHRSFYTYSVTVDLDRVGTEEHNISLPSDRRTNRLEPSEKARRVQELLEIIKCLYRDIRNRRESLRPLFVVGAILPIRNPVFLGSLRVRWDGIMPCLDVVLLKEALELRYCYRRGDEEQNKQVGETTVIGIRPGIFANEAEINTLGRPVKTPSEAIDWLITQAKDAYGVTGTES